MNYVHDLSKIENKFTRRRYHIAQEANREKLVCPKCRTDQIQLVKYLYDPPAGWKCRSCKYEFDWEPLNPCP